MFRNRIFMPLSLLFVPVTPAPLHAAWETLKIDTHTMISSVELADNLAAYEKEGDILLYQISSGTLTNVTQDAREKEDTIIGLDEDILWYWEYDPGERVHTLHRYDVRNGEDLGMVETASLIDQDEGTADAGRVVVSKENDWFLFDGEQWHRVTFSGEALPKQDAWLSGEHLVWRTDSGTPGVYVTHLPTRETVCVYHDDDPPASLWVSGPYAAWVTGLAQARYWIFVCRIDTGAFGIAGFSEERVPWQLAMDAPNLVWLKKTGPLWQVMVTNVEDQTEECLYISTLSMHTPRVDGDHILLTTKNCRDGSELCSELNVLSRNTGVLTQLTYFGRDSLILSPRIDGGRIAFRRNTWAVRPMDEVHIGFEVTDTSGWALPGAGAPEGAVNMALFIPPLALVPWHRLRRRLRSAA